MAAVIAGITLAAASGIWLVLEGVLGIVVIVLGIMVLIWWIVKKIEEHAREKATEEREETQEQRIMRNSRICSKVATLSPQSPPISGRYPRGGYLRRREGPVSDHALSIAITEHFGISKKFRNVGGCLKGVCPLQE